MEDTYFALTSQYSLSYNSSFFFIDNTAPSLKKKGSANKKHCTAYFQVKIFLSLSLKTSFCHKVSPWFKNTHHFVLKKYFNDLIYEPNQIDIDLYSSLKNQVNIYLFFFYSPSPFFLNLLWAMNSVQTDCRQVWASIIIPISMFPLLSACTFGHIHGLCLYPICSLFKLWTVNGLLKWRKMELILSGQ